MNYYNKKCLGCGEFFSNDKNSPSYVENPSKQTLYCQRCFKLKNYSVLDNSNIDIQKIAANLSKINFDLGSLILVVDIFNIKDSLIDQFKKNSNLLIAINKINFFTSIKKIDLVMEKIKEYIKYLGWNQEVIFYDSVNKFNIKKINSWIEKKVKAKQKIYVVGKTNVGKSSLINALLVFNCKPSNLSTSAIKNTTINFQQIPLSKYCYVIDTPGFQNEKNFLSVIQSNRHLNFKKMLCKSFVLKDENQVFFLEQVARIECSKIFKDAKCSITFFIIDNFKIHRTNIKNKPKIIAKSLDLFSVFLDKNVQLKETVFKNLIINKKYNIFINGIGIMSIKNVQEIKIYFPEHFEVNLFEKTII